jgi:DNA primase
MITHESIERIKAAAHIEEVIGDFIHLKKRGTSLIANCPFHGEKTPSFHVSVAKGIYKCFGCGVAGDAVNFVMAHEKYSYPEALKYLANKYNIEVEETVDTQEQLEANSERESLYIVSTFAAQFFENSLWNTDDGRAIGLSYFKERGFREDILKKFNLGYSPDVWDAFTKEAVKNLHKEEFLEKTGLAIRNDKGLLYDRFRGRVMFPIHNFSGRIIGFGGRTLKTEKSVPKYVNSPESDIYHKSNVLYGLYHAKKAIRNENNCYLVEGYADVLALHQASIENVVASSGTSLTIEQIKLIARFTQNVTILYDGDPAGIKASLRGLDMILEEGLNVKIVSFPDGDDPDSYMHKVGSSAFKAYIETQRQDFILYKANILLADAGKDPIKRSAIIRDLVESIAKIPDSITASVFVRECSLLLEIEERVLISELNTIKRAKLKKAEKRNTPQENDLPPDDLFDDEKGSTETLTVAGKENALQEREVVRLLLCYGDQLAQFVEADEMNIGSFIIQNLNDVEFEDPICEQFIRLYSEILERGESPKQDDFLRSSNNEIATLAITLTTSPYTLSENWTKKHQIYVRLEEENLKKTVLEGIFHLKKQKVEKILLSLMNQLKENLEPEAQDALMLRYSQYKNLERQIANHLGAVITK